ncbi:MAG: chemotaxis protein CheR [Lentisphaerae bacterium GWF2_52_8]|nr:MAG: chemotaxis protein CheR [Lentisphaerae bacterium GWF2_52_8]
MAFAYFFRDMQTLEVIQNVAAPVFRGRLRVRIWDAGCAMGPEPYSLAIILRENMGAMVFRNLTIRATDVDSCDQFGATIAKAVYPDEQVKRIPEKLLKKYFEPINGTPPHFRVVEEIRARVSFSKHNLLSLAPPSSGFDLILCKNVLLHFPETARIAVMRMFHSALATGGFLALEQTQKLPEELSHLFRQVSPDVQIFQKK